MSGKSTYMKQVALNIIMTHIEIARHLFLHGGINADPGIVTITVNKKGTLELFGTLV